ncbi:hypothetical protein F1880_001634 [Penicillium rolfsii]|nr:hypothetical protein F1880_001634 [Penicillium rolfsii]
MPAGRAPEPAYVEDFDEDVHRIVPDSRHSANTTANTAVKISSRLDQRFPAEPLIDGASDSGYSSRTAATATSTQSGPSGGRSPPVPLKLDMPKQRTEIARKNSRRAERKDKDRERVRPEHVEKQMGTHPHLHAHVQRSSSKSRRRDSAHIQQYPPPDVYYERSALYLQQHPSIPAEGPPMDYSYHFARPPVPDYPPASPQTGRYPYAIEEYHRPVSRPTRSNSYRGGMYHPERPMSMHSGMMGPPPAPMYHQQPPYYEHGPPPASSAYVSHPYASSPYGGSYYGGSEYGPPSDYPRERSHSRTRERSMQSRARRPSSVYGQPPMDHSVFPEWMDEAEQLDWAPEEYPREVSREMPREIPREIPPREYRREREVPRAYHRDAPLDVPRGRAPKPPRDRDEDYYKMPPPPPPAPQKHKAQVHQLRKPERPELSRKVHTTQAILPPRRQSRTSMDMSEMAAALPEYGRRVSRDTRMPERSHSHHEIKRSNTYRDSARGAQIAVENSRRRRQKEYHYDDYDDDDDDDDDDIGSAGTAGGMEDREREAERYQAQQSGRTNTMPASAEALLTKGAVGAGSDNGSQKSRSTGSRGSGSGNGDSKNMNLMVNGLTIGFTEESVAGKNISIRAGDTGRVQLSIAGDRKPKQYIMSGSSYSDQTHQTGRLARRELEEAPRRPREDLRSGASRRSSQSTYGGTRRHAR